MPIHGQRVDAGSVQVKLYADVKQYMAAIGGAIAHMGAFTSGIGKMATRSAIAFGAITAAMGKMATDFDKRLREISTLLIGVTENDIANMSQEIRELGNATGQALDRLGRAKYDIISAGFIDAAESMQLLNTSARMAVAGVTQVDKTADLLTSALNSWQESGLQAEHAADVLFTTVRLGKTTVDELVSSVGRVFPTAASIQASLEDVGAAMATITAGGIKSYEAATYLNQAFTKLGAPADNARRAMDLYGIEIKRTDDGMLDLVETIRQFEGYDLETMRKFFPEIRAIKAILTMRNNIEFLERAMGDMKNAAGANQEAFEKMEKAWSVGLSKSIMKFKGVMVEIGNMVMPKVVESFDELSTMMLENKEGILRIAEAFMAVAKAVVGLLPHIHQIAALFVMLKIATFLSSASLLGFAKSSAHALNNANKLSKAAVAMGGNMGMLKVGIKNFAASLAANPFILWIAGATALGVAIGKSVSQLIKARNEIIDFADKSEELKIKDIPIGYKINVSAYFDKNAEKFIKDVLPITKKEMLEISRTRPDYQIGNIKMLIGMNQKQIEILKITGKTWADTLAETFENQYKQKMEKMFPISGMLGADFSGKKMFPLKQWDYERELYDLVDPMKKFENMSTNIFRGIENNWDKWDKNAPDSLTVKTGIGGIYPDAKMEDELLVLENLLSLTARLDIQYSDINEQMLKMTSFNLDKVIESFARLLYYGYDLENLKYLDLSAFGLQGEEMAELYKKLTDILGKEKLAEMIASINDESTADVSNNVFKQLYDDYKKLYDSFSGMNLEIAGVVGINTSDLERIISLMYEYKFTMEDIKKLSELEGFDYESLEQLLKLLSEKGYDIEALAQYFRLIKEEMSEINGMASEMANVFKSIGQEISSTMAESFTEMVMSGRIAMQELESYNKGLTNNFRTAAEIREASWENMWNNILIDTTQAVIEFGIQVALMAGALLLANAITGGALIPLIKAGEGVVNAASALTKFMYEMFSDNNMARGLSQIMPVKDAVITPQGQVIQTHPNDYIMAMKEPKELMGGVNNYTIYAMDSKSFEDYLRKNPQAVAIGVGNSINKRNLRLQSPQASITRAEY